jgi:hypothetical protein
MNISNTFVLIAFILAVLSFTPAATGWMLGVAVICLCVAGLPYWRAP